MWNGAGPRRNASGLRSLLTDPYALARLIARSALERAESRGAHRRSDEPLADAAWDGVHLVIEPAGGLRRERWA
jgi:aspartate oxidase